MFIVTIKFVFITQGAFVGVVTSIAFLTWITIGSIMYPNLRGTNSRSIEGCTEYNTMQYDTNTTTELNWLGTESATSILTTSESVEEAYL